MKITGIKSQVVSIPLVTTFKTALRSIDQIASIAETAGIPCMIGSMMECHISVSAAAHLAASRTIIDKYDLDAPLFCSTNPVSGGISYQGARVCFSDTPGLGIEAITVQE